MMRGTTRILMEKTLYPWPIDLFLKVTKYQIPVGKPNIWPIHPGRMAQV